MARKAAVNKAAQKPKVTTKPNKLKAKLKSPIFVLPPFRVEAVMSASSEVIDWGAKILNIPNLWRQTKGEGIKVAVLDTGIATDHPDLRDSIADAKDFTGSRVGYSDVNGHGTHVSGTIAARENSSGIIGIAPKSKLLVAKVLGDDGYGSMEAILEGMYWAIDNGANVLSMSLGSQSTIPEFEKAIKYAMSKKVFMIVAAGNEGPNLNTVGWPGRYPDVVAVGAVDSRLNITNFSSRGPEVDIVAPGDQILSTYPPRGLAKLSGTSMATPLVSGVVALMLAKHRQFGGDSPIVTQKDLLEHLRKTATDLGPSGHDSAYGFGLINPEKLLGPGDSDKVNPSSELSLQRSDLKQSGVDKLDKFMNEFGTSSTVGIRIID